MVGGTVRNSEDPRHGTQEVILKIRYKDNVGSYFSLLVWIRQISMSEFDICPGSDTFDNCVSISPSLHDVWEVILTVSLADVTAQACLWF